MDKTITQESYPNLDLFMPTEQASVMKLPPLSTSFVEQGTYSQKGSLRITLTKPWEELDDTLRLSMAEMKNSQPEYLFPKVNDTILNDWPANEKEERLDFEAGNYAKWRNLTLVAKSIHRFKTPIVERIKSAVNLRKNVNSWSPIRGEDKGAGKGIMYITPGHIQNEALNDFREQADMFKSIERGSEKDIEFVVSCLKHDHRSNMYEADSVYRLANKPNHKGYTPLYIACKNGHLNLVKILLDFRANPYQICNIYPDTKESVLTVATRWGHFEIVRHLLGSKFFWPHRELKKAYEEAENTEIKSLLKNKMNVSKRSLFQRFLGPNDKERDS